MLGQKKSNMIKVVLSKFDDNLFSSSHFCFTGDSCLLSLVGRIVSLALNIVCVINTIRKRYLFGYIRQILEMNKNKKRKVERRKPETFQICSLILVSQYI